MGFLSIPAPINGIIAEACTPASVRRGRLVAPSPLCYAVTMREEARTGTARQLRRRSTDAEQMLWRQLRSRSLAGAKFRRQQPVGPYVVDFVCIQQRLIIELDGGQHAFQTTSDKSRTSYLQDQGYRVVRFWNNDVLSNTEGVLTAIEQALAFPHPGPLPQAGEGERRQ